MLLLLTSFALAGPAETPADMTVHTEDAQRFFDALDAHDQGMPLRRALRKHYHQPASDGLSSVWKVNIGSVGRLTRTVRSALPYYRALQTQLPAVQAEVPEIRAVHERLEALLPEAVHPDVYLIVGRLNSAGTLTDDGLFISLEMFGRDTGIDFREGSWLQRVNKSATELDAIVAHELAHYQQPQQPHTVLEHCLVEGIADVFAEVLAGRHTNPSVYAYAEAHHDAIFTRFEAERDQAGPGRWMYRSPGISDWPQDLGYYAGYTLAKPVFETQDDPGEGLRVLLAWQDGNAFWKLASEANNLQSGSAPLSPGEQTQ